MPSQSAFLYRKMLRCGFEMRQGWVSISAKTISWSDFPILGRILIFWRLDLLLVKSKSRICLALLAYRLYLL